MFDSAHIHFLLCNKQIGESRENVNDAQVHPVASILSPYSGVKKASKENKVAKVLFELVIFFFNSLCSRKKYF